MGLEPSCVSKPDREANVIQPKLPAGIQDAECIFSKEDEKLIRASLDTELSHLGY